MLSGGEKGERPRQEFQSLIRLYGELIRADLFRYQTVEKMDKS